MKKLLWFTLLLPIFAFAQVRQEASVLEVHTSKPAFSIQVTTRPNDNFSWFIKRMDTTLFEKVDKKVQHPRSKFISTPGTKTLDFVLKKAKTYPKSSEIILFYAPSKTSTIGTIKKFTVNINSDTTH